MSQTPSQIKLHTKSATLELVYGNESYHLTYEFLRVHSPSAEVKGHGKPVLQTGKKDVKIRGVEPVGNYALKISFDDGHDTGLYSWAYLLDLCENQETLWEAYLERMEAAGESRGNNMIGKWSP
jgi:DUF971 family protein